MKLDLTGVKDRMAERQIFINRLQMKEQDNVEGELEKEATDKIL
ncbi:hypothetical protein [Halanaerobaculum tunisiense]